MYNFKQVEEEARKVWKKHKKEIDKAVHNKPGRPLFSFLEGPPTANAPPGLHHLEVRTFKDIICKFKYMRGFSVPRKQGWDCHGLPVEVQVEKDLGLKDKKDILKYGVGKFITKAKKSVFSNISDWEKSTQDLAYWIDLKNPYVTLENEYIESVWWSLKEIYKKKLLYEGHKVVPFCPRCGTPLSSHEVAQGYKDVQEDSIYIAFKLKNKSDEYILAWTTTPWTLPGNVALAVGKNIDYVKVQLPDGDKLILGKEKLNLLKNYKILEKLKGKNLVGLGYEPLYDIKETQNKNSHKVILADFVTTEEGTGVVHTAVMYGEDDYNVGIKAGLPAVHTVGEDGKFLNIVPKFKGKFVKDVEKDIIQDLKERKLLFKTEKITHTYPFCWRCESPLLYYGINSWFIKVSSIKNKLVKLNKQINWEPEHIKEGRFGKWLEGAKDWTLSRFKFWGTPLPIWKCECGNEKVIGSIAELKKESCKKITGKVDLHKPWIDNVKLKCKCGKEMKRIPDVIDCWYDSGSATFAQFHYPFENKKEFAKRFSYDFIAEAIDQTRGWFYTLHVLGGILFDKPAYKNVICAGHIVDEKGEKMSKSKGNVIEPKEIIEKGGVDAIRLQFCTTDAGSFKRFSFEIMKDAVFPFLTILYNLQNYYIQLENKKCKKRIEDKWLLSRLNSLVGYVTEKLENYNLDLPFKAIMDFVVEDLSRSYIKMTRDREDTREVVKECLEKVALLLAPFAPYISEYIYQNFNKKSVHLSSWPKPDKKKIDKRLEYGFGFFLLNTIEKGLAEREKLKRGLKWPLNFVKIKTVFPIGGKFKEGFEEIIKTQLNVKDVEIKVSKLKPREPKTWKMEETPGQISQKVPYSIARDMKTSVKKTNAEMLSKLSINFDTKPTPELEAEGYAREMSRQVQAFRKKIGLEKKDKITLCIITDEEFKKILEKQKNFIKERTNSKKLEIVTTCKERFKNETDFRIKDKRGQIWIK